MPSPLDAELRHHAKALRGLARSLVGGDADDLLQDAALEALQQQRPPAALRAWLQQVLRHLAGRHRRDEALRRRRESEVPPPRQAPPTDRVAEHRETLRRLDSALLALPEPYQGTLLLRYFEDLTPSQIAEQTQVPLATVKSRLQRGLLLLRERLDRDGAWRSALLLAFGLERALPVAATVTTGAILMTTATKLTTAGIAAVLAVGAWFLLQPPPPTAKGTEPAPMAPIAATAQPGATAADSPTFGARREVTTTPTLPTLADARLHGRCVDEHGQPLAGIHIELLASRTDSQSLSSSSWRDQSLTTTTDGRFQLRFPPLPHVYFTLEFHGPDRCTCRGSWRDLAPGQDIDLGDVLLPFGFLVRGRVVDTTGAPVAGVQINLQRDGRGESDPVIRVWPAGVDPTAADGSFTTGSGAPAGRYWASTRNRQMARETSVPFTLAPGQPVPQLELVVFSDAERPPICGIVVDAAGMPLADASVQLGQVTERTDRDGHFAIRAGQDSRGSGPFLLEASCRNYESAKSGPYALGTEDVRIVLRASLLPTLRVLVRAADTGAPIEAFAASLSEPVPANNHISHFDFQRCRNWPHGVAVLTNVAPGDRALYVDPGEGPYAPSSFVPLHVDGDADVRVDLPRRAERRLRLQTADGAPIAAAVELLDCVGSPPQLQSIALDLADWNTIDGPPRLLSLQRGDTDAQGELLLRGPAGRDLALRLRGDNVALQIVQPIRLDGDGPLLITPQPGARWTGRLLPADLAAELFAASQPAPGQQPGRQNFGIVLWRRPDENLRTLLEPPFPYAGDGSFRIDGIPAGTWNVNVYAMGHRYPATTITVTEGQTLHQDLDVEALRPVQVTLQFFVDGWPLAAATANVYGEHAPGSGDQPMRTQYFLRTDGDGKASFATFAGSLGCEVVVRRDGTVLRCMSPAIAVPAAATFAQVVDLHLGGAQLRLLRPDGQPAANQVFELVGVTYRASSFQADADGRAELRNLPAGTHRLRTRVRSLGDRQGQDAFMKQFGYQALQDAWLEVGTIDIQPGAGAALELRLPPTWDR